MPTPSRKRPPELPLERGEFAELVLRGALRDPSGPGKLTSLAERFLGMRLGGRRWVVLTNNRLLVLRRRNPKAYRKDQWFDVSLDRAGVRVSPPFTEGSLVVTPLVTRKGPLTLLLPERSFKEAQRLARSLGTAIR
jgi:hypothetical protein